MLEGSRSVDELHFVKPGSKLSLLRALWHLRSEAFDWLWAFTRTISLSVGLVAGAKKMALHHHSWGYTPRGSERIDKPGALIDAIDRDLQVFGAHGVCA